MNTTTESIMKAKEKIAKLKEQVKRKAATAGIILAASATMASCSPKQAQHPEENTDKQEQLSAQGEQELDEKTASFEDARWKENEYNRKIEEYKQMIADGADLDKYTEDTKGQKSVLFWAVESGNLKGAELLLEAGANPNLSMKGLGSNGSTPVFFANSLEMVKLLEKYGADLNYKNKDGKQPLHGLSGFAEAYVYGNRWNEDVATYLIEKGNSISNLDYTYSCMKNPEQFKFYLEKGVKLDMQKALANAIDYGNPEVARLALANGGKKYVNNIYPDGSSTPLLDATMGADRESGDELKKRHEIIRLLIDNGADIHKKCYGVSPLEQAHEMQNEELAAFLQKCTVERTAKTQAMQAARAR